MTDTEIQAQLEALTTATAIVMAAISEASEGGREMLVSGLQTMMERNPDTQHVLRRFEAYLLPGRPANDVLS